MPDWAKRAVKAALINSVIWLLPPPVHLVAAVMPLISGYGIGSTLPPQRRLRGLAVGAVMGLTLGALALAAGGITLLGARLVLGQWPPGIYLWAGLLAAGGIALYTFLAGSAGALWAMRRGRSRPAPDSVPVSRSSG
jgi:hypothetical protein